MIGLGRHSDALKTLSEVLDEAFVHQDKGLETKTCRLLATAYMHSAELHLARYEFYVKQHNLYCKARVIQFLMLNNEQGSSESMLLHLIQTLRLLLILSHCPSHNLFHLSAGKLQRGP